MFLHDDPNDSIEDGMAMNKTIMRIVFLGDGGLDEEDGARLGDSGVVIHRSAFTMHCQ